MTIETKYDVHQSLWVAYKPQKGLAEPKWVAIAGVSVKVDDYGDVHIKYKLLWANGSKKIDEIDMDKEYFLTREAAQEECDRRNEVVT